MSEALFDTKERYCIQGAYTPERLAVHNQIIADALESFFPSSTSSIIFTAGGSASGKSTLIDGLKKDMDLSNYVDINADVIKSLLPEFFNFNSVDIRQTAILLHDESSDIANKLFHEALSKNLNIIYDGTMKNVEKYTNYFDLLSTKGYDSTILLADIHLDEALKRSRVRAFEEGRHLDEAIVIKSHTETPKGVHKLHHLADKVMFFDMEFKHSNKPLPFYVRENGIVQLEDVVRLKEFYKKGDINYSLKLLHVVQQYPGLPDKKFLNKEMLNKQVSFYQGSKKENSVDLSIKFKDKSEVMLKMNQHKELSSKEKLIILANSLINNHENVENKDLRKIKPFRKEIDNER